MTQKILIADDSAFMRLYLKRILAEAGYNDTIEVADGREMLIRYEQERPDLVILDIIMPDMGGLEALHELTRIDPKANVMMVTAVGQGYMKEDALEEVASIACGNASASLSSMLGDREIDITTPAVEVTPLKDIVKLVGGPKKLVVGIHTQVSGDLSGNVVAVFLRGSAFSLADLLGNKKLGTTQVIEEKDQKLINGAGLAIVSSYLSALKTFLELKVDHGDPKFFSAFGESVAEFVIVGLGEAEEAFLVNSFKTPFSMGFELKGEFMFLLALKPVDSLLRVIRNKLKTLKEG